MNSHLVSIVIPHHSRSNLLKKTLQSCLAQTYKNFEVIIVDDGSTKEELDAVTKLLTDTRCRLVKVPAQRGPSHARNLGFEKSRGEFIQFLDSDDVIHPKKIELQVDNLLKTGAQWVNSNWRIVFRYGVLSFPFPIIKTPTDQDKLILGTISDKGWFPVMTCLFRRSFLEQLGPWRENDFVEDREFRFRMLVKSSAISHVDKCLFDYNRYSFICRRNAVGFSREAWNDFVISNRWFLEKVEKELSLLDIQKPEFQNELKALRSRLPIDASTFSGPTDRENTHKRLTTFFLRSFVRNWAKQFGKYFSFGGKAQMTGGDL